MTITKIILRKKGSGFVADVDSYGKKPTKGELKSFIGKAYGRISRKGKVKIRDLK